MSITTVVSLLAIVTACTYDAYGCPSFPDDCRTECMTLDNTGCMVCNCLYLVSEGNKHPAGVLGNGCPDVPGDCLPSCMSMDDRGCLVCTCANAVHTQLTTKTTTTTRTMVRICFYGNVPYECNQNSG